MARPWRRAADMCGLCPLDTRTGGILPSPLMGPYAVSLGSRPTRSVYVHRICALWAPEVFYDETRGTLRNVVQAYRRGRHLRCSACRVVGATIGCQVSTCPRVFHFLCLQRGHCAFVQARYAAWCSRHACLLSDSADTGNLSADGPSPEQDKVEGSEGDDSDKEETVESEHEGNHVIDDGAREDAVEGAVNGLK